MSKSEASQVTQLLQRIDRIIQVGDRRVRVPSTLVDSF